MHRSVPLFALGLFFVAAGVACLIPTLRAPKPVPPNPKKSELREQAERDSESSKLRIAAAGFACFGLLLVLIS